MANHELCAFLSDENHFLITPENLVEALKNNPRFYFDNQRISCWQGHNAVFWKHWNLDPFAIYKQLMPNDQPIFHKVGRESTGAEVPSLSIPSILLHGLNSAGRRMVHAIDRLPSRRYEDFIEIRLSNLLNFRVWKVCREKGTTTVLIEQVDNDVTFIPPDVLTHHPINCEPPANFVPRNPRRLARGLAAAAAASTFATADASAAVENLAAGTNARPFLYLFVLFATIYIAYIVVAHFCQICRFIGHTAPALAARVRNRLMHALNGNQKTPQAHNACIVLFTLGSCVCISNTTRNKLMHALIGNVELVWEHVFHSQSYTHLLT